MQTSSKETTPSDDEDDDDDEEHMDESDFGIVKNIMQATNLDNSKNNVFCCGDNKSGGVLKKLLGQGNKKNLAIKGPGQAVQVIIGERGLSKVLIEADEMQSKKLKMADSV